MKCIPAGLVLATLFLSQPIGFARAEESAGQLADKEGMGDASGVDDDESAQQLAGDDAIKSGDDEESAAQLADQEDMDSSVQDDESAQDLAGKDAIRSGDDEESAANLAEQENLETKPKVTVSHPAGSTFAPGEGVNGTIYALAAAPGGGVIIGGNFNNVDGQPRSNLARIVEDGALDMSFLADEENGVSGTVYALGIDAKGNILAGGYFSYPKNSEIKNLIRYTSKGVLDPTFTPAMCPNGAVYAIAVQADGSVVIGGEFSEVGTSERKNIAQFDADGKLTGAATQPSGVEGTVRALVRHSTGSTFAGGMFQNGPDAARNVTKVPAN